MRSFAAGCLLAWSFASSGSAAGQDPAALEEKTQRAFALRNDRPKEALELYREVDQASGGRSSDALIGMGVTLLRLERPEEAVDAARRAVQLELSAQQSIVAYSLLGNAIYMRERAVWAQEHPKPGRVERERAPERPGHLLLVWKPGQLDEAEAALRKVLEISNGSANSTRLGLVEVLRRQGRWADAIALLEEYQRIVLAAGGTLTTAALESCLRWAASQQSSELPPGEITPPKVTSRVKPEYPAHALTWDTEGTVILEAVVTAEGKVECVDAVKRQPDGLTAAAVQAFHRWRFKPAEVAGEPIAVYFTLTVNFKTW